MRKKCYSLNQRSDLIQFFSSGFQISDRSEVRSNSIRSNSISNQCNIKYLSSQQLRPSNSHSTPISPSIASCHQCCCTTSSLEILFAREKIANFPLSNKFHCQFPWQAFQPMSNFKIEISRVTCISRKKMALCFVGKFFDFRKNQKKNRSIGSFCQF